MATTYKLRRTHLKMGIYWAFVSCHTRCPSRIIPIIWDIMIINVSPTNNCNRLINHQTIFIPIYIYIYINLT